MTDQAEKHFAPPSKPKRISLPLERKAVTHKFTINNNKSSTKGYLTVGLYPNGQVGEIFVRLTRDSELASNLTEPLLDAWANEVSLGLQYGLPLEDYVAKYRGYGGEPSGITETEGITFCQGPIDYIVRWLELRFVSKSSKSCD
jgi:ribonucleoside-diphosphate reductase alpha chain